MYNKVILIGHVGKDPEVRTLTNGKTVCNISLATSKSYRDKHSGEKVTQTEWHKVVLWNSLADIANKYLQKRSKVQVEGELAYKTFELDGQKKITAEIVANNIVMLDQRTVN